MGSPCSVPFGGLFAVCDFVKETDCVDGFIQSVGLGNLTQDQCVL
jgi:hypothetical protein